MNLHLGLSNYDFYQYKIINNFNFLNRTHYKVSIEYEHEWIQVRRGRDPYCKFDTKTLVLEVYNKALVTETFIEHLTLKVTNLITGTVITKPIKITWLFIPPTSFSWSDATMEFVHPIVETMYEVYDYSKLRVSINGSSIVYVTPSDTETYMPVQYYVQCSAPIADNEMKLTLDIASELQPFVTWDTVFKKLYIDRTAPLDGLYDITFKLDTEYLPSTLTKSIVVVYGDHEVPVPVVPTPPTYYETTIELIGNESIVVDETSEGYDYYYYEVKSSPVFDKKELFIIWNVINAPCDNSVVFDTDTMILKVLKGVKYTDTKFDITIGNTYNSKICHKFIPISSGTYNVLQG